MLDVPHRKVSHIIPTPEAAGNKSLLIVLLRSAERGEVGAGTHGALEGLSGMRPWDSVARLKFAPRGSPGDRGASR